jgi:hypothetical protein
MGCARPTTSFFGHYIISTHVFNCLNPLGDRHMRSGSHLCFLDPHQRQLPRASKGHERRHSGKRCARRSSADECVAPPNRTHEGYHQPSQGVSRYPCHKNINRLNSSKSATKADKLIVAITPVPHRTVATLQAALEVWL